MFQDLICEKYLICEFNSLLKTYDWWDTWFVVSFVNILLQCSYIFCSWTVLICFMIDLKWCMLESVTIPQTVANSIRSKYSHLGQPEMGELHLDLLASCIGPRTKRDFAGWDGQRCVVKMETEMHKLFFFVWRDYVEIHLCAHWVVIPTV